MDLKPLYVAAMQLVSDGFSVTPVPVLKRIDSAIAEGAALEVVVRIRDGVPSVIVQLSDCAGKVTELGRFAAEGA